MNHQDTNQIRSDDIDEIWSLFVAEGGEALDLVEECLLELEDDPTDTTRVPELFRAMHTFKGMAGMMGLVTIEALGHRAEDLIGQVRDEGVVPDHAMIALLLATLDQARAMLVYAATHRQDADPAPAESLLAQLNAMFASNRAPAEPKPKPEQPPPDREVVALAPESAETPPAPQPVTPMGDQADEFDQIEPIDPATDRLYVEIFLELAQEQISRITAASNAMSEGDDSALSELEAALDAFKFAAEQMRYERLVDILDKLIDAVAETDREQRNTRLRDIELGLFEELAAIQELTAVGTTPVAGGLNFAWLFRQWHAERVFSDLAHLGQVADELEQLLAVPILDVSALAQERRLADEATVLLQAIYHSCLFYKLEAASYLTLALEDLYARVAQAEMTANPALAKLTRDLVLKLGQTVDSIREGEAPEQIDWDSMIQHSENILYIHTQGQASLVTKDVLNLLDLPPEFKEVITPENLLDIAQALHTGQRFFTILADINQNETMAQTFFDWTQVANVQLITNITILRGNKSLFEFLLTTGQSETEIAGALSRIDPTGQSLSWEACALQDEIDWPQASSQPAREEPVRRAKPEPKPAPVFEQDRLAEFIGLIGKLLATHGMLRKVTERVAQSDLIENMSRWQRQLNGNHNSLWHDFEAAIEAMAEDAHRLSQIETEIGVGLDQLYETALAMRTQSISGIFEALQDSATLLAKRHGKQVNLDICGAEIDLDHTTLNVLDGPLQELVHFMVLYSLELPGERQAVGKAATGWVNVSAVKRDNRLHLTVDDDGRGLDTDVVLSRAQQLGWTQTDAPSPEMMAEWVLNRDFGAIYGNDDSNLCAVSAALRAHQGQLALACPPEGGLRFELTLPLNMSILNGMVMRTGQVQYVVPIDAIHRIVKPAATEIIRSSAAGGEHLLRLGESVIPIHRLNHGSNDDAESEGLMVVVEQGDQPIALTVEELIGEQQVLIQPLQGYIAEVRGVSGCALLGDGEVGMILDINQIELN